MRELRWPRQLLTIRDYLRVLRRGFVSSSTGGTCGVGSGVEWDVVSTLTIPIGTTLDIQTLSNLGIIDNGGSLTIAASSGSLDNYGTITVDAGASLYLDGEAVNEASGSIGGPGNLANGAAFAGASFTNYGTIANAFVPGATIDNYGTITNEVGAQLVNKGGLVIGGVGEVDNSGTFSNFATIIVYNGGLIDNSNGGDFINEAGGGIDTAGTITNEAGGYLENDGIVGVEDKGLIDNCGAIDNYGSISVACGGQVDQELGSSFTRETGSTYIVESCPCTTSSTTSTSTSASSTITTTFSCGTATTSTTIQGGMASADQSSLTGVSVQITGSSVQSGTQVTITSTDLSGQPSGTGGISLTGAGFYDVQVTSSQALGFGADATICITSSGASQQTNSMEYWDGQSWVAAAGVTVNGDTVCGTVPVSALAGTPIAIGTGGQTNQTGVPQFPGLGAVLLTALVLPAALLLARRRGRTPL